MGAGLESTGCVRVAGKPPGKFSPIFQWEKRFPAFQKLGSSPFGMSFQGMLWESQCSMTLGNSSTKSVLDELMDYSESFKARHSMSMRVFQLKLSLKRKKCNGK